MSVVIETLIMCDGGTPHCYGEPFAGDSMRRLSAAKQRKHFKTEGWYHKAGKDYCTGCAAHLFVQAIDALCSNQNNA